MSAIYSKVSNRGVPTTAFITELVSWATYAPEEVFEKNPHNDIYSHVLKELGPYTSPLHRRAVMCEVLRVLGGFESSWDFSEGRDLSASNKSPFTEEAGVFQCSANSMVFDISLKNLFTRATGMPYSSVYKQVGRKFIETTKENHLYAFEHCARLLRFTTKHHGPLVRKEVNKWLSRAAVNEFERLLKITVEEEEHPTTSIPPQVAKVYDAILGRDEFNDVRYIAEINYGINSSKHRLFIYDLKEKKLFTHKVSHGQGGKNNMPHDGFCREVSNVNGSHMSCLGLFKTGETYNGGNGVSMRLHGLSPTNSNALERLIVVHKSDYVDDNTSNICGRSWGCPSVSAEHFMEIISKLAHGSPLLSHYHGKFTI